MENPIGKTDSYPSFENEARPAERGDERSATVAPPVRTPNFLIIGAAKSGTTALWHYLRQHPEVFMTSTKHTRFFAFEEEPRFCGPPPRSRGPVGTNSSVPYAVTDLDAYHALFREAKEETAVGEASHSYMYQPGAAERIHAYKADMKLVAILRQPAERAFSHFRQMVRDGREPIDDFLRALDEEDARVRERWWPDFHYGRIGLYGAQLERYFELFARDRIRAYLYEDLNGDPAGVLRDVFRFLGVDEGFSPDASARYNASGVPKNAALHLILQKLRMTRPLAKRLLPEESYRSLLRLGSDLHNQNLTKPRLAPEVRAEVTEKYFRGDISKLEGLIGRDLSAWLG